MIIMMLAVSCASADVITDTAADGGIIVTDETVSGALDEISEPTDETVADEMPVELFGSDTAEPMLADSENADDDEQSDILEVWHHGMGIENGTDDTVNARLYDATTKYSWGVASQSKTWFIKCFNTTDASKKLDITNYEYVNAWVYNPEIKRDENGNQCRINVMLVTGDSASNVSDNRYCFYYRLPVNWSGWKLVSLPLSSFTANRNTQKEYGVFKMGFQAGGFSTSWPDESNYICIDRMWMSKTAPLTGELTINSVSVENYAGFVDPSLDGNNTYTVSFSNDIYDAKIVVERDGMAMTDGYTVKKDGKQLKIVFDTELDNGVTYSITVARAADIYGNMTSGKPKYYFTVGSHPTIFKFATASLNDGATEVSTDLGGSRSIEFGFNNAVGTDTAADSVFVEKNGLEQFGSYTLSTDDGRLVLKFDSDLDPNTHYTVGIKDTLCDIYGQRIEKAVSISFDTAQAQSFSQVSVFRADSDTDIGNAKANDNNGLTVVTDNTNLYDRTLRLDMPSTPSQRFFRFPMDGVDKDVQKYLNMWIYSPKKTAFGLNFCFFATGTTAYFRQKLNIDWSGWRLVSFPLTGFEIKNGAEWNAVYEFRISSNGWTGDTAPWSEDGYICVDKIFLTHDFPTNSLNITAVNPSVGYRNMPRKGAVMTFALSDDIDSADAAAMKLFKDGSDIGASISAEYNGNRLYVSIDDTLEPNADYSLKLGGVSGVSGAPLAGGTEYKFSVGDADICAYDISFAKDGAAIDLLPPVGSRISANARVISGGTASVFLTVAMYDKRGSLVGIEKHEHNLTPGDNNISSEFTVADGTAFMMTFVTDGIGIKGDYAMLGKEREGDGKMLPPGQSADGLTTPNASLRNGVLSISGTYGGYGPVCVTISADDGRLVFTAPLSCADDGSYAYSCAMADMPSGDYAVSVSAADGTVSTMLNAVSANDMAACLAKVNSASSAAEISAAIAPHKGYFGLNGESADMAASIATVLYENRPYASFDGLTKAIDSYKAVIRGLGGKLWSELTAYITQNHKVLLNDSAAYNYWVSLDDRGKNIINQSAAASLPTDNISLFRQGFDSAAELYKNSLQTSGGPSSGGVSSGGGSSSKGGGISGTGFTADASAVQNSAYEFNDIGGVAWAHDSIYALADSGIISKPQDGLFRPNDEVTREEFIKMLVAAGGIRLDAQQSGFADSSADEWYDRYLAAAKRAGIAAGRDDGTFGVGLSVSRQDAAVFIYRLSAAAAQNGAEFADDADIADYAKQAVYTMRALGIITGFTDGTFLPNSGLTRAEAAVITARFTQMGGR